MHRLVRLQFDNGFLNSGRVTHDKFIGCHIVSSAEPGSAETAANTLMYLRWNHFTLRDGFGDRRKNTYPICATEAGFAHPFGMRHHPQYIALFID